VTNSALFIDKGDNQSNRQTQPQLVVSHAVRAVIWSRRVRALIRGLKYMQNKAISAAVLEFAKQKIKDGGANFIIIKQNEIVCQKSDSGIGGALSVLEGGGLFSDSFVVDKIVGKAAAVVFVLGGVAGVYGLMMSGAAKAFLEHNNVACDCERLISLIQNKAGAPCPIEQSVLEIDDPTAALNAIKATLAALRAGK
jgi:hypothetical protein